MASNEENIETSNGAQRNGQNQTIHTGLTGEGNLPPPPTGTAGSSTQSLEARFDLMQQTVNQMMAFMTAAYPQFSTATAVPAAATGVAQTSPPTIPIDAASPPTAAVQTQGTFPVAPVADPAPPPAPTPSFLSGSTRPQANPFAAGSSHTPGAFHISPAPQQPPPVDIGNTIEAIIEARLAQAKEAEHKRLALIEEKVRIVQGGKSYSLAGFDYMPDVQLPLKFRMPDFTKYEGVGDPRLHVSSFLGKMAIYPRDEQLLIATFRESLVGPALKWYLNLNPSDFINFRDLSSAFLQKYSFNIDMAPSMSDLRKMQMRKNESVKEFATRWMLRAAQIEPTPPDRDLVEELIKLMPPGYYAHLFNCLGGSFSDFVTAAERVEDAAREGLLVLTTEQKRQPYGRGKGKVDEANATFSEAPKTPKQYKPAANNQPQRNQQGTQNTNQRAAPTQQAQGRNGDRPRGANWVNKSWEELTPLPDPLDVMYRRLKDMQLLAPVPPIPNHEITRNYNPNKSCEYH